MKKYKITNMKLIIGNDNYYQISSPISRRSFAHCNLKYIESLIALRHEYKNHYKTYQEYRL